MRGTGTIAACVGLALLAGGCDPLERRYVTEGAGVDLFTADRVNQIELLNAYESFICAQVGPGCGSGDWGVFLQAGMNDIDLRCDGFLTWLDAKRRDREPILAQISAVNTAVHTIMTVTGSNPSSLNIVTAAFGLASATYANWNSRLLISVNQATVQDIVYTSQGQYRDKTRLFSVPDRPTAIYLLRNYLRLCMPTTIEANINISSMLVLRGPDTAAAAARQGNLVVANVKPGRPIRITNINEPLRPFDPGSVTPRPTPNPLTRLSPFELNLITAKQMRSVLDTLCRPPSESDLGPEGSPARKTMANFLGTISSAPVEKLDRNAFIDIQKAQRANKRAC